MVYLFCRAMNDSPFSATDGAGFGPFDRAISGRSGVRGKLPLPRK